MHARVLAFALAALLCLGGCAHESAPTAAPEQEDSQQSSEFTIVEQEAQEVDLSTLAGRMAAGQVSSIRVIGDSITAGYLIEGFDAPSDTGVIVYSGAEGTYYETATTVASWTNSFRSYALQHGISSFVNAGVSGFRMSYLAEDPDAWLGEGADAIVVMLGTNDAAKESIDDFRAYAERALSSAATRCEHLVVVSPPDNDRTDATNLYGMDQIDEALRSVSESHGWEHISLYDVLDPHSDDFFDDHCHPTAEGSEKLWAAFAERLGLA